MGEAQLSIIPYFSFMYLILKRRLKPGPLRARSSILTSQVRRV